MNDPLWNFVRRIEFRKYVALKSYLCLSKAAQFASRVVSEEQLTRAHSCPCSPCNIQAYCSKVPPGFWRLFGSTPSFCLSLAASTCHDGYCKNGGTCSEFLGKASCRYVPSGRSSCLARRRRFPYYSWLCVTLKFLPAWFRASWQSDVCLARQKFMSRNVFESTHF